MIEIRKFVEKKEKKFKEDYYYLSISENSFKNVAKELNNLQDLIDNEDVYTQETFGREKDIHVTLFYGLKEDALEQMKEYLSQVKSFKIKIGKLSSFRNKGKQDYDVLKLNFTDYKPLEKIHNYIKDTFDNDWTHKEYTPHLTIAYVLPDKCKKIEGKIDLTGKEILIDEIIYVDKDKKEIVIKLKE